MKSANFTQIENDILEALMCSKLSASELQVALSILRKTNGWGKPSDQISYSQLMEMTGRSRQTIANCLTQLQLVNIIRLVKKGMSKKSSNEWVFNKDVDSWTLVKRIRLVKFPISTSQISGKKLVKLSRHTKESIQKKDTKEIVSKDTKSKTYGDPSISLVFNHLKERIGMVDGSVKQNRFQASNLLKKLRKTYPDNSEEQIVDGIKLVIDAGLQDSFHSKNLTNIMYLQKNFQKIVNLVKNNNLTVVKV